MHLEPLEMKWHLCQARRRLELLSRLFLGKQFM